MNEFVKDLKISKFEGRNDKIPELTPEDFELTNATIEAMKPYNDLIKQLSDELIRLTEKAFFDCMQDYLGCKSADDIYNILTTASFVRFNEIVPLINDRIKEYIGYYGSGYGEMKEPMKKSEEFLEKLKSRWNEIYETGGNQNGTDKNNADI